MGPVYFDCLGCVHPTDFNSYNPNGILRCGELYRMMHCKQSGCDKLSGSGKLFGIHIVDDLTFSKNAGILFNILRQKYALLKRCISKHGDYLQSNNSNTFWTVRVEICEFLLHLSCFVKRKVQLDSASERIDPTLACILSNLKILITLIGQMNDLPKHLLLNIASRQGNECQSSVYHLLHLHLDIRWHVLTILLEIPVSFIENKDFNLLLPKSEFSQVDLDVSLPFDQYVQLMLWDLLGIALMVFHKIKLVEYPLMTPFPCTCIRELWTLLLHLLDDRQKKEKKDGFWITLHGAFQYILQDPNFLNRPQTSGVDNASNYKLLPDLNAINRLGFCWWLLYHVSPLYQIDLHGKVSPHQVQFTSNYFEICNLSKLTLESMAYTSSESELRCYLSCCISICKQWEVSIEVPILLWEYFYKRLNDAFMEAGELTISAPQGKSGLAWLKHIKIIIDDTAETSGNLNSYQLFLRLLAVQLRKSKHAGSQREWKQLKGRIFAKFHPRKIVELNRSGLNNFFSLFLTLASVADLEDVVAKICDLLDMINPDLLEHDKYCVIWRAMFALMLISEEQQHDLAVPAQKMANDFNCLARQVSNSQSNSVQSHMVSALLNIYLEGLQDVFEHSTHLNLSEYILIASGFNELLSHSPPSDMQLALTVIEIILARHRIMYRKKLLAENCSEEGDGRSIEKEHYEVLTEALWSHVLPLLKEQSIGKLPHELLASVATGLTILMLDRPAKPACPLKETFKTLLQHFGFNLQTNADLCCKYLINLLEQPVVVERMSSEMPECQSHIIRAWFRLGMQMPTSSFDYQDLTRLVFKLPEMATVFAEAEVEPNFHNHTNFINLLLEALESQHSKKTPFSSSPMFRKRIKMYLDDVIPISNMILKCNVQNQISHIYSIAAHIVGHISPLIYVKGKTDCLLNDIVNCLLLPPVVYNQEKVVPAALLSSVKENLQLFITGIANLGFRRDPFINRTLKDVIIHYLPRFSLKSATVPGTQIHPLVVSLLSVLRNHHLGSDIFMFAIEVVRDYYLVRAGPTTSHLEIGLQFVAEILSRCTVKDRTTVCPVLVLPLLKLLLLFENQNVKRQTLDLLRSIIGSVENDEDENCRILKTSLKEVIRQYFSVYYERVFQLLGIVLNSFPNAVRQVVPYVVEQISEIEQKKGIGQDNALRLRYGQFLTDSKLIFKS